WLVHPLRAGLRGLLRNASRYRARHGRGRGRTSAGGGGAGRPLPVDHGLPRGPAGVFEGRIPARRAARGTGPADPVDGYGGLPARTRTAVPRAGGARGTRDRPGRARTRATVLRLARSAAGVNGALEPGAVFAGYRIERLLGTGGMGQVYLARDRDLP